MNGVFRAIQFAWTLAAWFLLASVVATPFVVLVQRCRARGRRLFRDLPAQRLGPRPTNPPHIDHRWDAL